MAITLPGIQYLQGYRGDADLVGRFKQGYDFTGGIVDEIGAKDALGEYVKSLYESGQIAPPPQARPMVPAMGAPANAPAPANPAIADLNGPGMLEYFGSVGQAESGGNDAARNPNSSAEGRYQFLDSTWRGLMQSNPELGLTADGRTDPAQQERAMRAFTAQNAKTLSSSGIPISPGTLYAAHFLGAQGASQALTQPDETPMSAVVSPEVIQANPQIGQMTVGAFKQWTAEKGGNGSGGYQPPMGLGMTQTDAGAGNGLPPREVLAKLFANPVTRAFGAELVQSAQKGTAPPTLTDDMKEYMLASQDPAFARFLNKSNPPTPPANVGEYNFYAEQERAAGREPMPFIEFQAAQKGNGLTVTTNPDGTTTVTQGGSGPGKLTEAQGKDIGFYTRGLQANQGLTNLESSLTDLVQATAGNLPGIGNYLRTPEFRQAKVEADNFLTALLRKDTGAAITDNEFALYGPMFLPVPGDDPATISLKRQKRATALLALRSGLGTAEVIAAANEATLALDRPDGEAQGAPAADAPAPGTVMDGYRFKGGDPGSPDSWEPI